MALIDKDQLKAEIERLKKENESIRCSYNNKYCCGYNDAFTDLLFFLDTLPDSEWTEKDKENWMSVLGTIYGAGLCLNDDDFVRNNELKKQAKWLESFPRKFGLMYHKVRVKETGECLWAEYSAEAAEYYALFSGRPFSPEEIEFVFD